MSLRTFYSLLAFLLLFLPSVSFAYDACDAATLSVPCTRYGYDFDTVIQYSTASTTAFFRSSDIEWSYVHVADGYFENVHADTGNTGLFFFSETPSLGSPVGAYSLPLVYADGLGRPILNGDVFSLEYYFSAIDEGYAVEDVGCSNDYTVTSCGFATSTYAIAIQATTSSPTIAPWRYEYLMTYVDGTPIEPQGAYSKATYYSSVGTDVRTDAIIFPNKEKKVYKLTVCDSEQFSFPLALSTSPGDFLCYVSYLGNGYSQVELDAYLTAIGINVSATQATVPTIDSAWIDNGCDELGITDFFPALKCAGIWAFAPSALSLQNFQAVSGKLLTIFPVGYATLIYQEIASSAVSTSTAVFDRGINFGKWFGVEGTATTTISSTALLSDMSMVDKIVDFLSLLLWGGFVVWLLIFGFTRTL